MRALLIGINYVGTSNELNGCHNDVLNIKKYLINSLNYNEDQICILSDVDDGSHVLHSSADKQNVLKYIEEFTKCINEQKHSNYFFHFSGHGTYMYENAYDSDEIDFKDECIVCQDLQLIKDDDIFLMLQEMKNDKSTLYVLMDCCHSGTIFDLNSNYNLEKNEIFLNSKRVDLDASIVMISGCMDEQVSFDANINNKFQGAMTYSFLNLIDPNITLSQLIINMNTLLKSNGYSQKPQLSFSNMTLANLSIHNKLYLNLQNNCDPKTLDISHSEKTGTLGEDDELKHKVDVLETQVYELNKRVNEINKIMIKLTTVLTGFYSLEDSK